MFQPARLPRPWLVLGLTLLAAAPFLVALAAGIVRAVSNPDSDFFTFWLAGRMNWTSQDPYAAAQWLAGSQQFGAVWIPNPVFPYPLPLATLLAPIGLLRLEAAYTLWVALSMVLLVLAVFVPLLRRPEPRLKHYIFPLMAGLVLFRPVWVTLRDGQLGALLLFAAVMAAAWWEDERWLPGGLAIALLALKPTLGLPVLGLVGLWLLAARRWRALAGMALGEAGLLLLGLARDPAWVGKFLTVGQSKLAATFGYSPSLWGMAGAVCGHAPGCTVWLGGALSALLTLGVIAFVLASPARLSPMQFVGMSLVVALLVTPYVWDYDQVLLLLPIALLIGELIRREPVFLINALAFLALDIAAILLLFLAVQTNEDVWSGLIPLLVGAGVLWAMTRPPQRSGVPTGA